MDVFPRFLLAPGPSRPCPPIDALPVQTWPCPEALDLTSTSTTRPSLESLLASRPLPLDFRRSFFVPRSARALHPTSFFRRHPPASLGLRRSLAHRSALRVRERGCNALPRPVADPPPPLRSASSHDDPEHRIPSSQEYHLRRPWPYSYTALEQPHHPLSPSAFSSSPSFSPSFASPNGFRPDPEPLSIPRSIATIHRGAKRTATASRGGYCANSAPSMSEEGAQIPQSAQNSNPAAAKAQDHSQASPTHPGSSQGTTTGQSLFAQA